MPGRRKPPLAKALAAIGPLNGRQRDEALVAALLAQGFDPLPTLAKISAIDVSDPEQVAKLAECWQCKPVEAVAAWERVCRLTMPFLHRQQPRQTDIAVGTPDRRLMIDLEDLEPICGRPPARKGFAARNGLVGCGHMSGLCDAVGLTAGPDGLRGSGPKHERDV